MNNDINFQNNPGGAADGNNIDLNELNELNEANGLNDLNGNGFESFSGTNFGGENIDLSDLPEPDAETEEISDLDLNNGFAEELANVTPSEIDEAVTEKHRLKIDSFTPAGIWKGLKEYWLGLKMSTRILAAASTLGIILFSVIVAVILNQSPYVNTFLYLEDEREAAEIRQVLKDNNIANKYDTATRTISVKAKDEADALGAVAMRGYPYSGGLFEYVEETSGNILESQQEKKDRELRNKQKRLEASLAAMTGIEKAAVNIVVPDNSKASLRGEIQPSKASVILHTKNGYNPPENVIKGIENMVQKSIVNLDNGNITIVDQTGLILNDFEVDEMAKYSNVAEIQIAWERDQEKDMYQKLMEMFTPAFPDGGFSIACNIDSDFNELIKEAKTYIGANVNEETGETSGVKVGVGLDHIVSSSDPEIYGNVVPEIDYDDPGYPDYAGDPEAPGYHEEFHYTDERLVNSVLEQLKRTTPEVTNKSVSVMLDISDLEEEELDAFYFAVGTAVGINRLAKNDLPDEETIIDVEYMKNYITIVPWKFPRPDFIEETEKTNIWGFQPFHILMALGAAVVGLIGMTIAMIAVNGRRKKEREEAYEREAAILASAADGTAAVRMPGLTPFGMAAGHYAAASELDGDDDEDSIIPIETKEQLLKKQIQQFAEQNPEIAAQLVRTLLKGDEMANA